MKKVKRALGLLMAATMVFGLAACGGTAPSTAPSSAAEAASQPASQEPAPAPAAADASGTLVVYSPHDADPLNAGVAAFMKEYPNVKVEVVAAGTGELCNRIKAESANPIADVLWGG